MALSPRIRYWNAVSRKTQRSVARTPTVRLSQREAGLTVCNCLRQEVADVFRGRLEGGYHRMTFENPGLPSGVYLYRSDMGTHYASRKLHIPK